MTETVKGKVLIIEDSLLSMKLISTALRAGNYTVLEAQNAQKGIEAARRDREPRPVGPAGYRPAGGS